MRTFAVPGVTVTVVAGGGGGLLLPVTWLVLPPQAASVRMTRRAKAVTQRDPDDCFPHIYDLSAPLGWRARLSPTSGRIRFYSGCRVVHPSYEAVK
jgi:hypothetical protein